MKTLDQKKSFSHLRTGGKPERLSQSACLGLLNPHAPTLSDLRTPLIQTKLTINEPGDKYEQEADRVAGEVMRMPGFSGGAMPAGDPPNIQKKCAACSKGGGTCPKCAQEDEQLQRKPFASRITPLIQRQTIGPGEEEEDEEQAVPQTKPLNSGGASQIQRQAEEDEEDELLQRKASPGRFSKRASGLSARLQSLLNRGGKPLPESERSFFEPRFSHDFSNVRVHSDRESAILAQDFNARAFTHGNNIVFGNGQFAPGTNEGRKLAAHELTHVVQQGGVKSVSNMSNTVSPTNSFMQLSPASSEKVWGIRMTPSMCGCRQDVRDGIAWANTAASTYRACDIPANTTGTDVDACFDAAHPGATTAGSTSASGTMTLPPPTSDPCERIENKTTFVHETMHSRHTNAIARAQGTTFFREWRRLAGDPNRLDTLRATFPAQVAAHEAQFNDGHDWARDEVNSFRWERRFLVDVLAALNRMC